MSVNRFKRIALYTAAPSGLLLALVLLLLIVEQWRTQAETGAVLSALFSQELLYDMDKWDAGRTVEIVIQRHPSCRFCQEVSDIDTESWFARSLKSRTDYLSGGWFAQSSRITRTSFLLNSVFSNDIRTDLTLPSGARAVFSDFGPEAIDFQARYPNNVGYFVVSHIGLNLKRNEALLYVDHFCSGLCGGGEYLLMRKANGVWHVVNRHGRWVS